MRRLPVILTTVTIMLIIKHYSMHELNLTKTKHQMTDEVELTDFL